MSTQNFCGLFASNDISTATAEFLVTTHNRVMNCAVNNLLLLSKGFVLVEVCIAFQDGIWEETSWKHE